MNDGNGTRVAPVKTGKQLADMQQIAYLGAVDVILTQSQYLVARIRKKVASADWDDAQSASRTLTGYATDLNRMLARVRGKGRMS